MWKARRGRVQMGRLHSSAPNRYPDVLARVINARIEGDEATALAEMTKYLS
jgi:hypothetical protein